MSSAISAKGVSKTFKVPHERYTSLKQNAIHLFAPRKYSKFEAVKDVSFEVKAGEFFGIVGRNGSGKSTLLKMLAGIYVPSKGAIDINGSLSPFIELGVGFNPELSARDNVFLNGAILGLSRKQIAEKFDEIIQFAELEEFVDQKLKNFSSGMQVRLAFSIAIQAQSQILLIDEVLAVGDSSFQKKCFDVFRRLKKEGRTIVFVTHDMGSVQEFCDRVLVIADGGAIGIFGPDEAADIYNKLNAQNDMSRVEKMSQSGRWGSHKVKVADVVFSETKSNIYKTGDPFRVDITLSSEISKKMDIEVGLAIYSSEGTHIAGPNSSLETVTNTSKTVSFNLKQLPLLEGTYLMTVAIFDKNSGEALDYIDKGFSFAVTGGSRDFGQVAMFGSWEVS